MRRFFLAASALAAAALVPAAASAQYYADGSYYYGQQPGLYVQQPGVIVRPPAPGIVIGDPGLRGPLVQSDVYLSPGQSYVPPGTQFQDQPVIIEGRRYYRDCWWDWGQRRCELKPWW